MRDLGDISSVFISLASFLTLISYKVKFSRILRCVFQGENGHRTQKKSFDMEGLLESGRRPQKVIVMSGFHQFLTVYCSCKDIKMLHEDYIILHYIMHHEHYITL